MNGKQIRDTLQSGGRVFGTAILSPAPFWPPRLRGTGIDFVFIDTEHIPIDRAQLSWMCRTYGAMDMAPIVRIPNHDPFEACKVLDGGAMGVIAPYIEKAEQLTPLVGATKYRPLKGRRLAEALENPSLLEPELRSYLERHNQNNLLIANIESAPAIENLDEILKVQGLDSILIGPHDLSCSLGIPEQYEHPRFDEAVLEILTKARAAGVGAGMHFFEGLDLHVHWIKAGENFIVHSADIHFITRGLNEDLAKMREAIGQMPAVAKEVEELAV